MGHQDLPFYPVDPLDVVDSMLDAVQQRREVHPPFMSCHPGVGEVDEQQPMLLQGDLIIQAVPQFHVVRPSLKKNDQIFATLISSKVIFQSFHHYSNLQIIKEMQNEPQVPNFMQYPAHTQHLQKQYLQLKTLPELQAVQRKQIEQEYMVQLLREVDYDNAEFYTKQSRMNRYCDIFAYEHSRVKVPQINDFYVNANEVRSLVDGKVFATFAQAPVPKFDNFWEAIYYKEISLVIMLCSFFDPKRGHQAQQYWPNQSQTVSFSKPSLKVTNALKKQIDTDFVETTFHIDGPDGVKVLRHLHWTGWSDLKKPAEGNMKPFEFLIEECIKLISEEKNIIIHCSAGIGRTGTLGGIIEAIRLYEKNKKISIYQIVENMRKYRYYAVQTFEQYNFMYDYLRKILK